jgi:Uma2 family endonuclease
MDRITTPSEPATTARPWHRYRFTDAEFDRMVRAGVFRPGSRAFLWNGEIVEAMAEDQPHLGLVSGLLLLLAARFPAGDWTVNVNQPVQVRRRYRPQPDLVVLRGPKAAWMVRGRVPGPADVALLVEVSDTSYAADSGPKLRKYAEAGVAPYWIVNVNELRIEVHSHPLRDGSRYRDIASFGPDDIVPLVVEADVRAVDLGGIPVREILAGLIP